MCRPMSPQQIFQIYAMHVQLRLGLWYASALAVLSSQVTRLTIKKFHRNLRHAFIN